jgi:hypothetical protein
VAQGHGWTEMSFESAQQMYDQAEPDPGYDWDDCMDNNALLAQGYDEVVSGPDDCPTCPLKHRCGDGIMVIGLKRSYAIEEASFQKWIKERDDGNL